MDHVRECSCWLKAQWCSCVLVYLIVKIDFLIVTCVLSSDNKAFPIKLIPAQMHCLKKMRRHVLILLVHCFLMSSSFKSSFSLPCFFFLLITCFGNLLICLSVKHIICVNTKPQCCLQCNEFRNITGKRSSYSSQSNQSMEKCPEFPVWSVGPPNLFIIHDSQFWSFELVFSSFM